MTVEAKDALSCKRLKMDEDLSKAQIKTMEQEATGREKEVAVLGKETATSAKEAQAGAPKNVQRFAQQIKRRKAR